MGRPAKYPPEFQREAVELVLGSGRSINEVALSLGDQARHVGQLGQGRPRRPRPRRGSVRVGRVRAGRAAAAAPGERRAARRPRDPAQGSRLFRPRDDAVIRFRFVEDHRGVYDVKRMCALVEVPRSSFYAWAAGPTAAAQARRRPTPSWPTVIEQVWRELAPHLRVAAGVGPADTPTRHDGVASAGRADHARARLRRRPHPPTLATRPS